MKLSEEEKKYFNDWKEKRMTVITGGFKELVEQVGPMSLRRFGRFLSRFSKETFKEFAEEIGVRNVSKIPAQFLPHLLNAFVGGLNSVLPRDYTYIVVCVFSELQPDIIRIGSGERKKVIPGAHDIISSYIVPIIKFRSIKLPRGDVIIKNFTATDINFGDVDDLERFI